MLDKIDHIVYAVPDLDISIDWFREVHGLMVVNGGRHVEHGTKNALLQIGNQTYLELLTIDHSNVNAKIPRWMGIDDIEVPTITRWSIVSKDIESDAKILQRYNSKMGMLTAAQRLLPTGELLKWKMTLPLSNPIIETVPFLIDWQESESHPCDKLIQECSLVEIKIEHPNPSSFLKLYSDLEINLKVEFHISVRINMKIKGPYGMIEL